MTNKDTFKIILCSYGFDRNIKIDTYRGDQGFLGYDIYAENKEGETYHETACEDFMFHVYMILDFMKSNNISFKSDWWSVRIKDVCNDEKRDSLIKTWDKRDLDHEKMIIEYKPILEWREKNNPCPTCTINKKDHWDIIHYKCELNHTHNCNILNDYYDKLREMNNEIKTNN